MVFILEGIFKGLIQWLYGLILEIVEYIANGLLGVFNMDLAYFETVIPVTGDIVNILIAAGWALLLGNLVFQAAKTMMSGLGFEGEDPQTLFTRTFVFAFLLLASRQVCEIGLGISNTVITLLQVPSSVTITLPDENAFAIGASWLLVIIVGLVLMWQIVKLFFEVGERYFLVGFLTLTAPLAFAMGGSRNTADIFKGWARMFASMCLMMVLNVVFLKMLLSAMGYIPSGPEVLPWMIFVVAIARVARKIDNVVARIGLNPALTGDGLGRSFPGMLSYMVVRTVASSISRTAAANSAGRSHTPSGRAPSGSPPPAAGSSAGRNSGAYSQTNSSSQAFAQNGSSTQTANSSMVRQNEARPGTAGTAGQGAAAAAASATSGGTAGTPPGTGGLGTVNGQQSYAGGDGTAGTGQSGVQKNSAQNSSSRRSSVTHSAIGPAYRPGTAGMNAAAPGKAGMNAASPATAGNGQPGESKSSRPSRFSTVPPGVRGSLDKSASPGAAGMANISGSTRIQQGGATLSTQNHSSVRAKQHSSQHDHHGAPAHGAAAQPKAAPASAPATGVKPSGFGTHGTAGMEARRSNAPADKSGRAPAAAQYGKPGFSGSRPPSSEPRQGRNAGPSTRQAPASSVNAPARQEGGAPRTVEAPHITKQPPGMAGRGSQVNASDGKRPGGMGQGTVRISAMDGPAHKPTEAKKNRRSKGDDANEQ